MKKEEIKRAISLIKLNYPYFYKDYSEDDILLLINLWDFQFKNEDYKNVYSAIMYHISINDYPPTIANIKEIIYNTHDNKLPSNEEAWEMVLNASRINRDLAREEYNKLPGYLQKIITIETLIAIGGSDNNNLTYLKRDFLKDYQTIKEDQKEIYQISSISNSMKALESDDKKLLTNKL